MSRRRGSATALKASEVVIALAMLSIIFLYRHMSRGIFISHLVAQCRRRGVLSRHVYEVDMNVPLKVSAFACASVLVASLAAPRVLHSRQEGGVETHDGGTREVLER